MLTLTDAAFVIGAYLWGAIPSAYLVAKYVKGIDIREFGSGNVGASNVSLHVGKVPGFIQGVFDFAAKGILPVALAGILERDDAVRAAIGLAAIAGHNWSPYLRFTGGRGVAAAIGAVLGFGLWPEFLILLISVGIIGWLLKRDTGFWTLVAMFSLPVLAYLFDRPVEMLTMCAGIGVLLMAKRLTANWEPLPAGSSALRVFVLRALFDRDVSKQASWTERRPESVE
jgi:glycerol-3-phosphate acyltransferase PlsY